MEEYIYKNSTREKPCTVRLHDHHLEWACGTKTISMNYADIGDVRLDRGHKSYKVILVPDSGRSLTISNQFYLPNGKFEDRSRQYNTFVRVLHFHLRQKSNAFFFIGSNWQRRVIVTGCMLMVLFLLQYLSLVMNFISDPSIHQWIIGIDVVFLIGAGLLAAIKYPRPYSPENIPLYILP